MATNVFSKSPATDNTNWANYEFRQHCKVLLAGSLGQVRVTFQSGSQGLRITQASIGLAATAPSISGTPAQLFFGGNAGFTIGANTTITSDWVDLAFLSTDTLIVHGTFAASGVGQSAIKYNVDAQGDFYYKLLGTNDYLTGTVSGYSTATSYVRGLTLIETQLPPPTVTGISPTAGPTAGGTAVTITGTNFTGATSVTIGGVACTGVTVVNATTITATTGANTAGVKNVSVTTPSGTGTGNNLFTYVAAPTVTSISPTTGVPAGGTAVTITGTNLTGATSVKFGANNATSIVVVNSTTITCNSPAGTPGSTVHVTVTTSGGTSATGAGDQFTYQTNDIVLVGDKGDLTLTGKTATLFHTAILAAAKGDLAFTGRAATFSTAVATNKGDLTFVGRNPVLFTTNYVNKNDLLLQGRDAQFSSTTGTVTGHLAFTGWVANVIVALSAATGVLALAAREAFLTPTILGAKGDLSLTGHPASFYLNDPLGKADLSLAGGAAFLTPTIMSMHAVLCLKPNDAQLFGVGGGGSERRKLQVSRKKAVVFQREIEIVGKDGLPKKVPLLKHFAPLPPLEIASEWLGKPPPSERLSPVELPQQILPDAAALQREAWDTQDMKDAIAVLMQILDPVTVQAKQIVEDYLDMQDAARVLAELD